MKLFITNKQAMDVDLQHEAKDAHKSAYTELQYNINVNNSVPITFFSTFERVDYIFSLVKVDMEKELYMYSYEGSAVTD